MAPLAERASTRHFRGMLAAVNKATVVNTAVAQSQWSSVAADPAADCQQ